jgi:hypothetical protein
MIEHFMEGRRDRNLAPEGARPGFLHPQGHFVPLAMSALIAEFAHTLEGRYRRHGSGSRRGVNHDASDSGSGSYSSDESGSEYGSRRQHRRGSM